MSGSLYGGQCLNLSRIRTTLRRCGSIPLAERSYGLVGRTWLRRHFARSLPFAPQASLNRERTSVFVIGRLSENHQLARIIPHKSVFITRVNDRSRSETTG